MSVQVPPRMAPKARGMSSFDGLMFRRAAIPNTTGKKHGGRSCVFHDSGGQRGRHHNQSSNAELTITGESVKTSADHIDNTGLGQSSGQDKEAGDGDDYVVAKTSKRLGHAERVGDNQGHHENDRNDLDRNPLDGKEDERDKQQAEEQ